MKKLIELLSRWLWNGPTKGWLQLGMILALSVAASQACSDYALNHGPAGYGASIRS